MTDLDQRIREVLTELQLISEASAGPSEGFTAHTKQESKPPPGVTVDRDSGRCPSPEDSLYEHFHWRFVRADTDLQRTVILCQAEVSVRERKHGLSPHKVAGHLESLSSEVTARQREEVDVLIRDGEGVHAAQIAAETGWPIGWIRSQRERRHRDAEYGRERPDWAKLTEEERATTIALLAADGLNEFNIHKHLGISRHQVKKYWPEELRKAA